MVIIYPNNSGISIVIPSNLGQIQDVALKDVPTGVPYKIVDKSLIPIDREFRNAWEADFSEPDGYGMGHAAWAAMKEAEV